MGTAIAIGQGAGMAVACGLAAALPLALAAVVAALASGAEPGAVSALDDGWLVGLLCALGVADAGVGWRLPDRAVQGLRAVGGAAAFELVSGHDLPFAGLALGLVLAAGSAIVALRIQRGAGRAGSAGTAAALAVTGALGVAALALVPFVGYALVVGVGWLVVRARRRSGEKYAGLRILR